MGPAQGIRPFIPACFSTASLPHSALHQHTSSFSMGSHNSQTRQQYVPESCNHFGELGLLFGSDMPRNCGKPRFLYTKHHRPARPGTKFWIQLISWLHLRLQLFYLVSVSLESKPALNGALFAHYGLDSGGVLRHSELFAS